AHPRRLRAAAAVLRGQPLRARGRAEAGLAATPKEPRPAMGKIALWIVVIIVVMLAVRAMKPRRGDDAAAGGKRPGAGRDGDRADQGEAARGELMMSCAVCGVHLPASDAVF